VAIASLYRALVRRLVRDRSLNRDFSAITRALSEENRWRAQRYGTNGTYIDLASKEAKPFKTVLDETIAVLAGDIDVLRIASQIEHLRAIVRRGTSAHLQLELYRTLLKFGRRRARRCSTSRSGSGHRRRQGCLSKRMRMARASSRVRRKRAAERKSARWQR
jgi:gamma-glutamyl:cysteine ligase YbdK (ATP-grasp superfamily)